ncbi:IS66 family transposase [Petrocella sp. FN5]|uniref:IS66 family transposase n=1 Tax=Petrocella sp. FN5 TaxID=3032002 RepID=UPI0023DB44C3|nr:transposase [Petrocella sp. FN5]MDF1618783.1 transposase [Petrocella sp. FN5]
MNPSFELITSLEYRLKAATSQIRAFKSGHKYVKLKEDHYKKVRALERQIKTLELELSRSHCEVITIRNQWFEIFEELQRELNRKEAKLEKENKRLEKKLLKAERQRDDALNKVTEQRQTIYAIETDLEIERGKNLKLTAQINRDYENSSLPSSKSIRHKKITNSREKTGRRPGAQPGHKGHCRKKQIPTSEPILLLPPQEILDDSDFKKTSKTIVKQQVRIRLLLDVTEYHADVYYNAKTGERCHANFPPGVVNDVNYDGSIKAFLFLLNNECCTSIDKSRKFLSDLTDGKLNISKGMINNLCKEFAKKSEQDRKALFADMLLSPVMHTDCTNAKVNGKSAYVFICATPDGKAMYFAREKKGHEGVKGTPTEDYQGILVHDHERTFFRYGTDHQECLAHVLRYLKDSVDNESERTWNIKMHSLIREMIHYRNELPPERECAPKKISEFEGRYDMILQKATEEYEYIPPSTYYRDGYNLYLRMKKYKANHLLFLHNRKVPTTNNEAERLLRSYKRKQAQAMSFRSQESIDYLCQCMSMLVMMRQKEETNIFDRVSKAFG